MDHPFARPVGMAQMIRFCRKHLRMVDGDGLMAMYVGIAERETLSTTGQKKIIVLDMDTTPKYNFDNSFLL